MKKFICPNIFLFENKAYSGFDKETVVSDNPVELARKLCEKNADAILVYDLSVNEDKAHDAALDVIKEICAESEVPVIGAGNVKRMEDIKKLLYAGCAKACLNYAKSSNIEITEEVSLKFGKDKICACIDCPDQITDNMDIISKFCSSVIITKESMFQEYKHINDIDVIVSLPEIMLNKVLDILTIANVTGITGTVVNKNINDITSIKALCRENGIFVDTFETSVKWEDLKLNEQGMVPVIVQDYKTDQVLMLAYMNKEAYEATLRTGKMTYWSRSRNELWEKGDTSGHFQYVKSLTADCDMDTILAKVRQIGAACHTGNYSCFFNDIVAKKYKEENANRIIESVIDIIKDRKVNPKEGSYTNYLFDKGIDKILKKMGEEATEIVIAAKNPNPNEIKYEIADFLYHMMVLMVEKNVSWEEIVEELERR